MFEGFLKVLSNEDTRDTYRRFISTLVGDPDEFLGLVKADKRAAEDKLLERVIERRSQVSPATLKVSVSCLRSFLDFEEVTLNYRKIRRAFPAGRSVGKDRAPTLEEVRRLLDVCDRRMRIVVLVMCSSGVRVGAFNYLNVGDYERLESGIGRLKVYAGDPEEYVSFLTPEACIAVEQYFDERRKTGEDLKPKSPFIRQVWDYMEEGEKPDPRRLAPRTIQKQLYRMWLKAGLKVKGEGRGDFKQSHSFRKFFKTRAERSMKSLNVELLLGHSVGLGDNYYRPSLQELEGDYLRAVPDLTVSEVEQVKREAEKEKARLEQRLDRLEGLVSRMLSDEAAEMMLRDRDRISHT